MKRIALVVAALISLCACSPGRSGGPESGSQALPADSVQDWVTYGDYLVEWTGVSERELDPEPQEVAHQEGTITRLVTMQTSAVAWKRPSAPGSLRAPRSIEISNGGWTFHGARRKPLTFDDSPRLEIGRRYLAVISYADLTAAGTEAGARAPHPEWLALSWFALDDGQVVPRDGDAAELSRQLRRRSVPQVASLFDATPVDVWAGRYLGLDPVVRFQRASDDRDAKSASTPRPGPGEQE